MRVLDWRLRFEKQIDTIRRNPFAWGNADCLFGLVAPIVREITGDMSYFHRFEGRYKTARGALGTMKRNNFDSIADLVASEFPEIHPSQCVVGDIAAIPTDDNFAYSLGIVNGDRIFVMHQNGLGTRDLLEATRAFKVI